MKITFNAITATIRQNADGLYSLTDIAQAWEQSGGTGGRLDNWKIRPEVTDMIQSTEIQVFDKRGGKDTADRGTWGCKEAVIEYASYCSPEFRRAVRKAFIALTEGKVYEAAAIAESVAISPELVAKYDDTRETMISTIIEKGAKMGGYAIPTFSKLVCKASTGYAPTELTGSNGSAKSYVLSAEHLEAMSAMIATMETIIRGLLMGLDYHQIAAMLNVKTSKNRDLLDYSLAA